MAGDGTWLCVGSEGARQQQGDKVAMASLPSSSKSSFARLGSSSSVTPTRLPTRSSAMLIRLARSSLGSLV
uniref:Uncharacterized protein n=1 Tax=Oryza glumipatula TaxID=40148 RepID=A0A0E0AK69_9ORYZ